MSSEKQQRSRGPELPLDLCARCGEPIAMDVRYCPRCGYGGPGQQQWVRKAVMVGLAVLIVGGYALWSAGALDGPLSNIGLNKNDCVENLFGNKMCGDELVSFCEERYNARVNGNVCDGVLSEAGIDPEVLADEQQQAEREYERCVEAEATENDPELSNCELP